MVRSRHLGLDVGGDVRKLDGLREGREQALNQNETRSNNRLRQVIETIVKDEVNFDHAPARAATATSHPFHLLVV